MIKIQNLTKLHAPIKDRITEKFNQLLADSEFIGGDEVQQFERSFAEMHGFESTISCGNGTDALYIALKSLKLPDFSEVLVTSLTWISSSEIITQAGHKPVFVDVGRDSFNVTLDSIKSAATPNTKAIILVHLYGIPCDMVAIAEFCRSHGIRIIEDCAQAHFASCNHQFVGTFGDVATFSFYPGKNLGALGDAGAISTNDHEISDFCRLYSKHGAFVKHKHLIEGINSRMDSIQAAVLNLKLPEIKGWTNKRREIAGKYLSNISNPGITLPKFPHNSDPVWHLFTIEVTDRGNFIEYLREKNIECATNYPVPVPLQPCYKEGGYGPINFPNAVEKCSRLVNIPMCPTLSDTDVEYIIEALNAYSN